MNDEEVSTQPRRSMEFEAVNLILKAQPNLQLQCVDLGGHYSTNDVYRTQFSTE